MIGTDSYHIKIEFPTINDKTAEQDYRYSKLEITSIDPDSKMTTGVIEPLKAQLLGQGIIRLYREYEDADDNDDESKNTRPGSTGDTISNDTVSSETSKDGDATMVAIIALPTYFTATDLLGFIGEYYMKHISHIRILKSEKPNRFLVMIKFRDIVKAAEFQFKFNGKSFNSMEPEKCHVIHVKSVRIEYPERHLPEGPDSLIPFLLSDPFTENNTDQDPLKSDIRKSEKSEVLMELPSCPVCLERMDAVVTGLLTIPCQHTFHCQCLSKWKDDTCPICRYSNNFSNQQVRRSVRRLLQFSLPRRSVGSVSITPPIRLQEESDRCMECSSDKELWICLVCGNIGCSRYAPEQHSLKHFINTGHCFAMELDTSRVWDYAGDNYVHRLVTNESDGKLVELPDKNDSDKSSEKKSTLGLLDEVGFDYSELLISQLDSQREYYELLLQEKEAPKFRRGSSLPTINQNVLTDLEIKLEDLSTKFNDMSHNIIPSLKDKIASKDTKLQKISKELDISNSLNEAISKKVDYLTTSNNDLKEKINTLNQEKTGLEEQVSDLMFFLDSQEKFKDEPQDVRDGTVVISSSSKQRRRKK